MKKTFFIFLLLIASLLPVRVGADSKPAPLLAGTSKIALPTPEGAPLAGFGKRRGKGSTGVHDPLFARAIYLQKGAEKFVVVSLDLVLIDEDFRKAVVKKMPADIPADRVILAATHTHSGLGAIGGRFWERFIMGKFRRHVFDGAVNAAAQSIQQAQASAVPAAAAYGETSISDLIENRLDEKIEVREKLRVLKFTDHENKTIAQLVFMAAHPTLLPASNLQFSADFPGALEGPVIFLNGAAADLRPKAPAIEDRFEKIKAYGELLNQKLREMNFSTVSLDGPWRASLEKIKLPKTKVRAGFVSVPGLIGGRFFPRSSYFQAVWLGEFLFLAFPGELDSQTGREIEKSVRARGLTPFFIGYANDYLGYVVPRRYYRDRSQYESQASFYGEKMEWFVQEQFRRLTNRLIDEREPEGQLSFEKNLSVLHLKGSAYHLGYEEGRLLRNQIRAESDGVFKYLRKQVPVPLVNRAIFSVMLNKGWKKLEPYTTYSEYLQMKGIADGAGVSFKKIKQLHALPEVYPSWCSNGAYWGKATEGGRLIAIRNLDWNRGIGVHNFAAVKIIETPGQKTYANIGYAGFAGVLSGMNEKGISVGQIGATSSDESLEGTAMPFLLRRILAESDSLDDVKKVFESTRLTRGYNYVIADAMEKKALVVEATHHHLAFFEDQDPKEVEVPYALRVENAVFRGDPALDPTIRDLQWASKGNPKKPGCELPAGSAYEIRYHKHGELVLKHYGAITPEVAMEMAKEIAPGSNLQSVIYAYPDFWVANAEGDNRAVDEEYIRLRIRDE